MTSTTTDERTSSPGVADNWEDDESGAGAMQQLEERVQKVKILQRNKAEMEKAKCENEAETKAEPSTSDSLNPLNAAPPMRMQILRRPKSDDNLGHGSATGDQSKKQSKTLEERQAAYDEARNRIMGTDYNPETASTATITTPPVASRSKSPEQIQVARYPAQATKVSSSQPTYKIPPLMAVNTVPPQNFATSPYGMPPPHNAIPYAVPVTSCQMPVHQPIPQMPPQSLYPFLDTSRPPPKVVSNPNILAQMMAPPPQQFYAIKPYGVPTTPVLNTNMAQATSILPQQLMQPQQVEPSVAFGHPPVSAYGTMTLGSAMHFKTEPAGGKKRRKKHGKANASSSTCDNLTNASTK